MLCSSQNNQFIDKILHMRPKDIKALLKDEDEKYIIRKQRQIIQNMPEYLKPNQNIETKATSILKNLLQVHHVNEKQAAEARLSQFPSTFNEKTKSHHWNVDSKSNKQQKFGLFNSKGFGLASSKGIMQNLMSNFEGFKSGLEGAANLWKGERLPQVKLEMNEVEKVQVVEYEKDLKVESLIKAEDLGYHEKQLQKESLLRDSQNKPQRNSQPAGHQSQADNQSSTHTFTHANKNHPQQNIILNPFAPPLLHQQKHSPFISNKMNFLDLHTNKKPLNQNYLAPETYSMNMLHYAHNQKRENTFADAYSYPNVIMGGSGPGWMKTAQVMRDNPFKKTFVTGPKFEGYTEEGQHSQVNEKSAMNVQRSGAKMQSNMNFRENVQEVLKYTLGDKRYTNSTVDRQQKQLATSINIKSNVMESSFKKQLPAKKQRVLENPFVRRPVSSYKY